MPNMMPCESHSYDVSPHEGLYRSEEESPEFIHGKDDSLFNRIFTIGDTISNTIGDTIGNTLGSGRANGGETMSIGQVHSMSIPEDWVKRGGLDSKAMSGLSEYHPAGHHDVKLNSFYRGMRIGADAAQAFKECLEQAPHLIEKGSEELHGLTEILGEKARNFNIGKAFTEVLNGKKVLVVEGSYKDAEHTTSQTRYIDSDGTGSAVQELSYTAPGALFKAYKAAAEGAIKSIIWK